MDQNSIVKFVKDIIIGGLTGIFFSIVARRLLVYAVYFCKKKSNSCAKDVFDKSFILSLFFTFLMCLLMMFCSAKEDDWNIYNILTCLSVGALMPTIHFLSSWLGNVNDLDLIDSQSVKKSIGAMWAIGAYKAYYEIIFKELSEKIKEYENAGKHLDWKKLILVCPLSCNIHGKLGEKYENIFEEGTLPNIEYDQGANTNRCYKLPVYKVSDNESDFYLLIQLPSSLGTLWQTRDLIPEDLWQYHRSCFLENLKELLKNCACSIIIYDDTTNQAPLYQHLISTLNLKKEN